ncbi:MAG TPA: TetR/AcrR family transcriptional regulator C-terminal domain-containing protein [Streptosporangiaceae bacterium]
MNDSADEAPWELPASIEAAWGVRDRPHKGPKPGLSLTRIVAAGVAVAEAEGLAAVSMSRVATELGASTMSLYRYVSAKDELLDLMVDAAFGPPPPPQPGQHWRAGLTQWAWGMRGACYRHPWALRIPIRGLPVTPNSVAWFENGLSCLADTSLEENRKASTVLLISNFVRAEATTGSDIGSAIMSSGVSPADWMATYGRLLAKLADPGRFPALTQLLASGAFDSADEPEDEFVFGLTRILDGVAALVSSRGES